MLLLDCTYDMGHVESLVGSVAAIITGYVLGKYISNAAVKAFTEFDAIVERATNTIHVGVMNQVELIRGGNLGSAHSLRFYETCIAVSRSIRPIGPSIQNVVSALQSMGPPLLVPTSPISPINSAIYARTVTIQGHAVAIDHLTQTLTLLMEQFHGEAENAAVIAKELLQMELLNLCNTMRRLFDGSFVYSMLFVTVAVLLGGQYTLRWIANMVTTNSITFISGCILGLCVTIYNFIRFNWNIVSLDVMAQNFAHLSDLTRQMNLSCPRGSIKAFLGDYAPDGWLILNGDQLQEDHQLFGPLAKMIQTRFDPDNKICKLPDLRGRTVIGADNIYKLGITGGQAKVALETAHLPKHNHDIQAGGSHNHEVYLAPGSSPTNLDGFLPYPAGSRFSQISNPEAPDAVQTESQYMLYISDSGEHFHISAETGLDKPHENMMPYAALNWIVKY